MSIETMTVSPADAGLRRSNGAHPPNGYGAAARLDDGSGSGHARNGRPAPAGAAGVANGSDGTPADGRRGGRRPGRLAAILADPAAAAELRRRVEETSASIRRIAIDMDVPAGSLDHHIRREGWSRPPGASVARGGRLGRRAVREMADAAAVQVRLLRAVDRQVVKIDARLRKPGAEADEKDARTLASLAKTLATLMAPGGDRARTKATEPADSGYFRAELARKIAAWAAERGEPARPHPGAPGGGG